MSAAAPQPAMCGYMTRWAGAGRHRHSSGHNPTFRCVLPAGHEGAHALERQPYVAPVIVAPVPAVAPAPIPICPTTLAEVERARARFTSAPTRALPTTEYGGRVELIKMAAARGSSPWHRHTVRMWLEGVLP